MKKLAAAALVLLILPSISQAEEDIRQSLADRMRFLNQRQSVISQNIANANTPGFKSMDLESSGANHSGGLQLATTNPMHITSAGAAGSFKRIKDKDTGETAPNGNNVVLEEQIMKMSETDREYSTAASVMRQMNGLMRTAVGAR